MTPFEELKHKLETLTAMDDVAASALEEIMTKLIEGVNAFEVARIISAAFEKRSELMKGLK